MLVHVVDPSAYTPPYDHALCAALGRAGARVQLHTSRFDHGALAPPEGYERVESFYRHAPARGPLRRAAKLAEHVPDMLRYHRAARAADVVHLQWLPLQPLDARLLPARTREGRRRPVLLTAHDVLPREPRPGQLAGQRRLYERVDGVIVHSEHGRGRLERELGLDPARVHVVRHGALTPWEGLPAAPVPTELAGHDGPVVLFFGLLRPYKGLDLLLRSWGQAPAEAELWIVGAPRMDVSALRASSPAGVRWLTRFVSDGELQALTRRASLAVLPYREIDQSGVAFTALGAGLPSLLSDVGGFPELAATGAAATFPAGDADALAAELRRLLGAPERLLEMAAAARVAAGGEYSWDLLAARTIELYRALGAS
ncbi:MAG TPA: glycosyltransferase family 4 protein [Solirubrobacteraceae bacterium]|nr:glycosyltransferase family 4 protein [Solirubrobacteraceae bacterium]